MNGTTDGESIYTVDPQSVIISPGDYVESICEPQRVADEISCNNFIVWCKKRDDIITLRIVSAGEILYHAMPCYELVAEAFDYDQMEDNMINDLDTYNEMIEYAWVYTIEED